MAKGLQDEGQASEGALSSSVKPQGREGIGLPPYGLQTGTKDLL
jgi:hypothetical protein